MGAGGTVGALLVGTDALFLTARSPAPPTAPPFRFGGGRLLDGRLLYPLPLIYRDNLALWRLHRIARRREGVAIYFDGLTTFHSSERWRRGIVQCWYFNLFASSSTV